MKFIGKTVMVILSLVISMACEPGLVDDDPMTPQSGTQENTTILLEGNISTQSTEWVYTKSSPISIPQSKIDSIIFQAPLRSVNASPGAEAILFDESNGNKINSSLVISTIRYTIQNKRSANLKGYFSSGDYLLKVGLRSQSSDNPVAMPYEAKLIIYYQP
ncbi:hypothetical protein JKA74_16695 [Marivirga sp. S37H4]|uniref:Uncharacterized protein n=1 Tax=Marivirga aurantiaca TaxID=2802615 RepID=A0A934X1P0_9BACT|nr:hypothetical protein [Marivirga aurantiaca]MBK6266686.1 hypothetical protein [Marivirga aurantiaca]